MTTLVPVDFDPFASKTKGGGFSFDDALRAEGVSGRLADVARSIYQQESGSGSNTRTSNAGAVGGMQIIPGTFQRVADRGWDINNPEHNLRAGIRYLKTLAPLAGDKPELIAAGYYGGEGAIPLAAKGQAVRDPRNPNAPDTLQYGQQVAGRLSRQEQPAARGATLVPVDFDPFAPPVEKEKPASSTLDVARNAIYGGAAAIPDSLLNTPNALVNLLKAGAGTAYMGAGGDPQKAPQPTANPDYVRRLLERIGVIKGGVEPEGMVQKATDVLLRGATAGALTGGGGLAGTLGGAGLGALSTGSAAATEAVTGSPEAAMIAGLVAPAAAARAPAVAESAARRLMQSSMKPNVRDLRTGNAERAITTALDEGINVTRGGVDKLDSRIQTQNDLINNLISNSSARVDPALAANRVRDTYRQFANQADPHADLNAVDSVLRGYQTNPVIQGAQTIPVQLAQSLKQGTYNVLKGKYGEQGSAATEAQKAIARGLKEEIAAAVPQVVGPNARESALLNARDIIARRANMQGNNNPVGLTPLAHQPLAMATFLADRSALAKSLIARALHTGMGHAQITPQAQQAAIIALQQQLANSQNSALAEALTGR